MTAPAQAVTAAQKRDLRQLAGAAPLALWLALYVDAGTTQDAELGALIARNNGDLRLAAADLLDGLADGAETVKRLKLEGELEVEFLPVQYASKSGNLRLQVASANASTHRYSAPLAGIATARAPTPQLFTLSNPGLPADNQRLDGLRTPRKREEP